MTNQILALPYECWGWYPGYEGIAQVSTRGQVQTVDRWITDKNGKKRFIKGRILRPVRGKDGYLRVTLSRDGKQRTYKVHRLVAETWLDNPENKPQVNHLDENKENCSVENLSYCSAKANINWGTGIKRRAASRSMPVQAIDVKTGEVVLEFPSMMEAGRKGFDQAHVSLCCRGKRRTHKGYKWRYKP